MFAIMRNTNETWMSIQAKYREGVYMTLDVNGADTDTGTKETQGEDACGTTSWLAGVSTTVEQEDGTTNPATKQPPALLLAKERREVLLKLEELKTLT